MTKNSLATTANNMKNVSDWNFNHFWYKENFLSTSKLKLMKGPFKVLLSIDILRVDGVDQQGLPRTSRYCNIRNVPLVNDRLRGLIISKQLKRLLF